MGMRGEAGQILARVGLLVFARALAFAGRWTYATHGTYVTTPSSHSKEARPIPARCETPA